jgi:hypothetical protein
MIADDRFLDAVPGNDIVAGCIDKIAKVALGELAVEFDIGYR